MKKDIYNKKKLQPITLYLSPAILNLLSKDADNNRRSRKAQRELILETYAQSKKEVNNDKNRWYY